MTADEYVPLLCGLAIVAVFAVVKLYGRRCSACNGRLRESGVGGWSEGYGHWDFYRCSRCDKLFRVSQRGS